MQLKKIICGLNDEFVIESDKVIHKPTGAWFLAHPGRAHIVHRSWGHAADLYQQLEIQEIAARLLRTRLCPAERVAVTFQQWKNLRIPDETAFYHTALDIKYRHGGLPEKIALAQLRCQRSMFWEEAQKVLDALCN